jgi:transposase
VVASRVHSRTRQRVRDIPTGGGGLEVVWCKRRWFCDESLCGKKTFAESTIQVPRFARSTVRLKQAVLDAVCASKRAACDVARGFEVSWWFVQAVLDVAVVRLADPDTQLVRHLGVDEHRYRSVRFFREADGSWRRYEPWMSTFVDACGGAVLGVVDGRDSAAVADWLKARSPAWRDAVEVVAIDPSAAFRKAIREQLPRAAVSVDHFHLVKLGNDALTKVRQRLTRQINDRRGRLVDPSWANRHLLLRGADTLSGKGWNRLEKTFRSDDPTGHLEAAWGIKERLRMLLRSTCLNQAQHNRMILGAHVVAANIPEMNTLWDTINAWWPEIEVLIVTGVTNARTEAANTTIKHIKRTGRGFRNPANYKTRILLTSAAPKTT